MVLKKYLKVGDIILAKNECYYVLCKDGPNLVFVRAFKFIHFNLDVYNYDLTHPIHDYLSILKIYRPKEKVTNFDLIFLGKVLISDLLKNAIEINVSSNFVYFDILYDY